MFKELSKDDIFCISLILIPGYMLIHLSFLPYFQKLWSSQYIQLSSQSLNELFNLLVTPFSYLFILLGLFFWIAPKILLSFCLVTYWLVQAPTMNILNWHDQHVAFLTFICLLIFFFKKDMTKPLPLRRLVLIFLAMFYYGAGLGKLHTAGFAWMDGNTSQYRFIQYYILYDAKLGLPIAENFLLCKAVSILTVLFEVSFPVCLFFRRLEKPYLWASFLFLSTIYITMKINFFLFLAPIYIIFLPWDKISPFMMKRLPNFLKKDLFEA